MFSGKKSLWWCAIIFICLGSCNKDNDIQIQSDRIKEFDTLKAKGIFDIVLHQDTACKLETYYYGSKQKDIHYEVKNNTCLIENKARYWIKKDKLPEIHVYVNNLKFIHIYNASSLTNKDTLHGSALGLIIHDTEICDVDLTINYTSFSFINSDTGSGTYIFKGTTESAYFWPRGTSHLDAEHLKAGSVRLKHNTLGRSTVNVSGQLNVTLTRAGQVFYKGSPEQLHIDNKAQGTIDQLE